MRRITTWVLPSFVLILIGCLYGIFLFVNILPHLQRIENHPIRFNLLSQTIDRRDPHIHKASVAEVLGVTIAFHILFFLFLISFLRSMITHPGSLPSSAKWCDGQFPIHGEDERRIRYLVQHGNPDLKNNFILRFLRLIPLVERKKEKTSGPGKLGDKRYCKYCRSYKPDRCHHCSVCKSCVLRMDHHCPWIGTCVGFHNYKFFLLLVFYALLTLAFMFIAMFPRLINVFQPIMDISYFLTKDMVIVVACVICAFMFLTLLIFFGFHTLLVVRAMTTIEYREKSHFKNTFLASHIKFDYGAYQNIVHIFGPPWMWFLPISPPQDSFLSLQYNFLYNQPDSKNEMIEKQRQRLLDHLKSISTKKEFLNEAGSYYTPLPLDDFQLWKLSSPELQNIPDEKPVQRAGAGVRRNLLEFTQKSQDELLNSQSPASDEEEEEEEGHEEQEQHVPEDLIEPIPEDEPTSKSVEGSEA